MSRVERLRSERSSVSVKFMEFMKAVSNNRSILVCFFEGEDEKYYSVRIAMIRPDLKWSGINCGGKSNVVALKNKINLHRQYKDCRVLFFIDKDYDDHEFLAGPHDIYVTPCYSIENLYVNTDTFRRILTAELGCPEFCTKTEDYEKAIELFNLRLADFCDSLKYFNTWIKAHRLMEKNNSALGKLNLNNIKITDLVKITLSTVTTQYDTDKIENLFPDSKNVESSSYAEAEEYFSNGDAVLLFRGKQQLEFLRVMVGKLKEELCKSDSNVFQIKKNIKLNLTKANVLSELSQYATTPECLRNFLTKY